MGDTFSPGGVDKLWRQSPLRSVAAIQTPLLMLQAESDQRCPAADNEQLFVALRQLGREVEYVLYPEESHVYASAGRPDRRIDRMTRMIDCSTVTCADATGTFALGSMVPSRRCPDAPAGRRMPTCCPSLA